ncbi:MAG TPA: PIG-L family deacetylase [Phenylobacterium sp.]|nr:PIG-L family deacetylase [Phenylobacterium sp.]
MAVVYLFAHFDDEYCALPLVTAGVAAGEDQHFLYVADYATPELARRRFKETRALLAHLGADPDRALHVGAGTGALDGAVHRALPAAYAAIRAALRRIGPVSRIVAPAWEGGHMDHDICAVMAARLASTLGDPPVETISLYNGPRLPGPLFHGAAPLPENGPVRRLRLSLSQWLFWMGAVRFFPSQAKTWSGLWPAMFWTYARKGFGVQRLDPGRIHERPHAGPLFYERMFKVPYAEVRAAADAFLSG